MDISSYPHDMCVYIYIYRFGPLSSRYPGYISCNMLPAIPTTHLVPVDLALLPSANAARRQRPRGARRCPAAP